MAAARVLLSGFDIDMSSAKMGICPVSGRVPLLSCLTSLVEPTFHTAFRESRRKDTCKVRQRDFGSMPRVLNCEFGLSLPSLVAWLSCGYLQLDRLQFVEGWSIQLQKVS